jgi:deoxyadenosine/deoxycytidine kinase
MGQGPSRAGFERNERPFPPLVGVVGPIGAGKSTLATRLAEGLGFRLFAERVDENPFFQRFAADPSAWAFRSQLAFMLNAVADAIEGRKGDLGAVIERPVNEMHAIFVRDQLRSGMISDEEEMLLRQVVEIGGEVSGTPDLLVAVSAPPTVLHDRIESRGRPGEENYSRQYIERLVHTYGEWLDAWDGPVIRVDTETRDFRRNDANLSELIKKVTTTLRLGTRPNPRLPA